MLKSLWSVCSLLHRVTAWLHDKESLLNWKQIICSESNKRSTIIPNLQTSLQTSTEPFNKSLFEQRKQLFSKLMLHNVCVFKTHLPVSSFNFLKFIGSPPKMSSHNASEKKCTYTHLLKSKYIWYMSYLDVHLTWKWSLWLRFKSHRPRD